MEEHGYSVNTSSTGVVLRYASLIRYYDVIRVNLIVEKHLRVAGYAGPIGEYDYNVLIDVAMLALEKSPITR